MMRFRLGKPNSPAPKKIIIKQKKKLEKRLKRKSNWKKDKNN